MIVIDGLVVVVTVVLTAVTSGWIVGWATGSFEQGACGSGTVDDGDRARTTEGEEQAHSGSGTDLPAGRRELRPADIDTGRIVGKCENILIILFVVAGAITGMALIFTAKAFVRQSEFQGNPRYYLVGTLVNTTYSVIMGFVARVTLDAIHGRSPFS